MFLQNLQRQLFRELLSLPRPAKRFLALGLDAVFCIFALWLAIYLRLGTLPSLSQGTIVAAAICVGLALPSFIGFGLYRAIFRYSGWPAVLAVGRAMSVYGCCFAIVIGFAQLPGVPRTVGVIHPLVLFFLVAGSRLAVRIWLGDLYQRETRKKSLPKALIYGAGSAGRQLAIALQHSFELCMVGFVDDDLRLRGQTLNHSPVFSLDDVAGLVENKGVTHVLLAIPSAKRDRRNEILSKLRGLPVAVRTLPTIADIADGKVSTGDIKDLDIDDLLGRDPVPPNHILLAKNITGKTVLVTGAGGSIGSELCRQILAKSPAKLLMVDLSEYALYQIHAELSGLGDVLPLLGSVTDSGRMAEILSTWQVDTLYHAAAYKHVPLVEHNPAIGVKNNLVGTLNTAQAALASGVSDFVLISTDKAVRPTNIMGASKRMAEMALQALAAESPSTRFSMVRFGNVLGSSGSVVPRFREQIRQGGPITLTHQDMTRYFMTIPEAAQLVIQAGAMARGGEVFVLDMGESVKIADLARRMVELSGLSQRTDENPEGDIAIELTGLRPGEKLYEELLIGDNPQKTTHPRIMKANEDFLAWEPFEEKLRALELALSVNDVAVIRAVTKELVSGYQATNEIVDWVSVEKGANSGQRAGSA